MAKWLLMAESATFSVSGGGELRTVSQRIADHVGTAIWRYTQNIRYETDGYGFI